MPHEIEPGVTQTRGVNILEKPETRHLGNLTCFVLATIGDEAVPVAYVTVGERVAPAVDGIPAAIICEVDGRFTDIRTTNAGSVQVVDTIRNRWYDPFKLRAKWAGHKAVKSLQRKLEPAR